MAYPDGGSLNDGAELALNNLSKFRRPPQADAAINAGELLESLGLIWEKATLEEKHRLLVGMLEAVYIGLAASRSIVGIQPKPPFYPLFESLRQNPDNKVTVFSPGAAEIRNGLHSRHGARF